MWYFVLLFPSLQKYAVASFQRCSRLPDTQKMGLLFLGIAASVTFSVWYLKSSVVRPNDFDSQSPLQKMKSMISLLIEKKFFSPKNTIILQKIHAQPYQRKPQKKKKVFSSVFVLMIAFTVTFSLAFRANPSCGCNISPMVQSWTSPTIVPSGKI